jgi:capsular exopolysaccharide synthesis family protein
VRNESALPIILRRKWIIITTFVVVVASAAVVSVSLEKVYSTSSRLLVTLSQDTQSFDTVQASQAIARSYSEIIDSPNISQQVADRLGVPRSEIKSAMSFEQVPETQLLKVSAEDPAPARAKLIADSYASVFIDYARRELNPTTGASISLADAAPRPATPARPRPTLYVLAAALLAAALGLALAFLRERLDRRLRTTEDVEAAFDVPVLARVPRRGRSDASIASFKEANRVLRTNLQFAGGGNRLGSIAVTSARQGEGKTTTTAGLAEAAVEFGAKVLAVEGDLRRPALQEAVAPEISEPLRPGLSNYLVQSIDLSDVIYPTRIPGLDLVPPGPLPPSPAPLLESQRAESLVDDLSQEADFVVIDCPPLTIGADASVIAQWVDGVVIVVDLRTSTDRAVRQAVRQLEAVQAPLLGFVVNRDPGASPTKYDYYVAREAPADRRKVGIRKG